MRIVNLKNGFNKLPRKNKINETIFYTYHEWCRIRHLWRVVPHWSGPQLVNLGLWFVACTQEISMGSIGYPGCMGSIWGMSRTKTCVIHWYYYSSILFRHWRYSIWVISIGKMFLENKWKQRNKFIWHFSKFMNDVDWTRPSESSCWHFS